VSEDERPHTFEGDQERDSWPSARLAYSLERTKLSVCNTILSKAEFVVICQDSTQAYIVG
jgi:hypothetical protein